jgi:hypothetical protein
VLKLIIAAPKTLQRANQFPKVILGDIEVIEALADHAA